MRFSREFAKVASMPGTQRKNTAAVKGAVTPPAKTPAVAQPFGLLNTYGKPGGMSQPHFEKLVELCGPRWVDLLLHLPYRLLDRTQTPTIEAAPTGERATIQATVLKRPPLPPRHIKRPLSIELVDGSGDTLRAVYFNPASWLERAYPVGQDVIVSGKIEADNKGKKIIHPDVWAAGKGIDSVAKLAPLYSNTAGLPHGWLTRSITTAVEQLQHHTVVEWLHPSLLAEAGKTLLTPDPLPGFADAVTALHHPSAEADLLPTTPARTRLALDELFASQLSLAHARATTRQQPGIAHGTHTGLQQRFLKSLPFPLTGDQTRAVHEIREDLTAPRPMLRLVQGDVGAGKTLVALMALLHVIENGHQGALMAPTAILAQQHYMTAKKYLEPLGITVGLLTGSQTAAQKKKLKQHVREGFVNLLIGTHALVEDDVVFHKLGLVAIDEQHRFGVKQRAAMSVGTTLPPDVLVLTATPIPRTLALTAYGDMESSIIKEKPPGRTPIQTLLKPSSAIPEIAIAIARKMQKNEQIYWVCPLVDESEESDLTAVTDRFETLNALYPGQVTLLHGKMKAADKDAAMLDFKEGRTKVLVATTVIEVGVDVPQATLMVIEHSERFGLSQLHQLRGRVGRGTLSSQCILVYAPPLGGFATERLTALRDSDDGFYLAEKDLELRGPGEVLGTRQSGHGTHMLADLYHHQHLIPLAKHAADTVWQRPLTGPQKNALAMLLGIFQKTEAAHYLRSG